MLEIISAVACSEWNNTNEIQYFNDQVSDASNFQQVLNTIHSGFINTFADSLPVNADLEVEPPPIAEQELVLPYETRLTLVQLRSGYCSRSNSYQKFEAEEFHLRN